MPNVAITLKNGDVQVMEDCFPSFDSEDNIVSFHDADGVVVSEEEIPFASIKSILVSFEDE